MASGAAWGRSAGRAGTVRRNIATVLVANALLAAGGVARDVALATYFGLSSSADALNLAWFVADFCGNVVLATVVATVAVPYLSGSAGGAPHGRLGRLLGGTLVSAALLAGLLALLARPLTVLLDPDLGGAPLREAVRALRWLAPYVVALPLAAALGGALQVQGRFAVPAFAPLAVTLFVVSGAMLWGPGEHVVSLAVWLSLGTVVALVWPALALVRSADIRPRWPDRNQWLDLGRQAGPVAVWYLVLQLGQGVDRHFASGAGPGGVAAITYASRYQQAPVWIYAAAVATVVYPSLAAGRHHAPPDQAERLVGSALVAVVLGVVPLALLLGFDALPLIRLVLAHGRLSPRAAAEVAAPVATFAAGLPAAGASALLFRGLFAYGQRRLAILAATVVLGLGAAGDALLAPRWGLGGIGAAEAVAQWAGCLVALVALAAVMGDPRGALGRWCREGCRMAAITGAALLVGLGGRYLLPPGGHLDPAAAGTLGSLGTFVLGLGLVRTLWGWPRFGGLWSASAHGAPPASGQTQVGTRVQST